MTMERRRNLPPIAGTLPRFAQTTTPEGRRRIALAVATAWLVGQLAAVAPTLAPWPDALFVADFGQFWTSAWIIREGAGPMLFDMGVQAAFMERLELDSATTEVGRSLGFRNPYFYPPPLALLFVPLTALPLPWAYFLWSTLSLMAFVTSVVLPLRGRPHASLPAAVMLSYLGVIMTMREGQVNALLPLSLSLAMLAMQGGRPVLGGALLGLLWLKPQYAVLFPLVLLAKRRWQELAGMVATGLMVAGLSLMILGPEGMARYLGVLSSMSGFDPLFPVGGVMVNWRALFMGVAPGLSGAAGTGAVAVAGGVTALLSLLAWRGRWDASSLRFPLQMLVAGLATVIATPHSNFYGTVVLLAPVAALMGRSADGKLPVWTWYLLGLGYTLPLLIYLVWAVPAWLLVPFYFVAMLLLTALAGSLAVDPGSRPQRAQQVPMQLNRTPR